MIETDYIASVDRPEQRRAQALDWAQENLGGTDGFATEGVLRRARSYEAYLKGSEPTPEPKVVSKGDSFYEDPLPKPRHDEGDDDGCLACEWINLKAKIRRAAENG